MKFIIFLLAAMGVYYSIANYGAEIDSVDGVIADIKSSMYICAAIICLFIYSKGDEDE